MHCKVTDDGLKNVHIWHHVQQETCFADGIRKLLDQINKCVEKLRDSFENNLVFVIVCFLYNKEKINFFYSVAGHNLQAMYSRKV